MRRILLATLVAVLPATALAQSDEGTRLRAALRQATAQMRALEDEAATLRAKQSEAERVRLDLEARLQAALALVEEARAASAKAPARPAGPSPEEVERLRGLERTVQQCAVDIEARNKVIEQARTIVEQWQTRYREAVDAVRAREIEAQRFGAAAQQEEARARVCEQRNAKLYEVGREILAKYEKGDGFFGSLFRKEPLFGFGQVDAENEAQALGDRLRAEAIGASGAPPEPK